MCRIETLDWVALLLSDPTHANCTTDIDTHPLSETIVIVVFWLFRQKRKRAIHLVYLDNNSVCRAAIGFPESGNSILDTRISVLCVYRSGCPPGFEKKVRWRLLIKVESS